MNNTGMRAASAIVSKRFLPLGQLGQGGMGVVYEAFDRETNSRVALKTLKSWSAERLALFKNEFRALADLHHENLIQIHELFCEDGVWFFSMELLEGTDFLTWVGARTSQEPTESTLSPAPVAVPRAVLVPPAVDLDRLRSTLRQLVRGVMALHASGKVHRDLKPSNVWVTPEGRVVVMDFGLVGETDGASDTASARMGSPSYAAPEQLAGDEIGPASDWYSIGVMMFLALTGGFPAETGARPSLAPDDLARLCSELIRKDPRARPSGEEILERLGGGLTPAVPLRPTAQSLVGRQAELSALAKLYDESQSAPVAVLVEGESGIGKSALCRHFVQALSPALVLPGRCYEREQVPYNALDGVMDALTRHLATAAERLGLSPELSVLRRAFPVLGRLAALDDAPPPEPLDSAAASRAIPPALRAIFTALAAQRPLVVWIDDLQWADGDSIALLHDLLSPGEAPRMLFVGTQRTGSPLAVPLASRLGRGLRTVSVGALPGPDAARFVASLDPKLDEAHRRRIVAEGAGHPLFLQELAWRAGAFDPRTRLDDALRSRVEALPQPLRHTVELVAVAGAPIDQTTLAAAAGIEPPLLRQRTEQLRGKGLIQWSSARAGKWFDTFHERVREAVLAGLAPHELRAHHSALAVALEKDGAADAAPERLVRHLKGSGQDGRVAEVALRAAERARSAAAFERAAEFFRLALESRVHTQAEGDRLRLAWAECSGLAGRGVDAAEAYLEVKRHATPQLRVEYQRLAAEHLLGSGHLERGVAAMEAVLQEVGEAWPRTRPGVWLEIVGGQLRASVRGLRWRAGQASAQQLLRLRAYRSAAVGLMSIDPMLAAVFHSRFLALALEVGPPEHAAEALSIEAMYRAMLGLKGAERILEEARAVASRTTDEEAGCVVEAAGGVLLAQDGELRAGADALRLAIERWQKSPKDPWLLNRALVGWLHNLDRLGALQELFPLFDETLSIAARRGDRHAQDYVSRACFSVWLARDDLGSLRRALAQPTWSPKLRGYSLIRLVDLYARAGLALYSGELPRDAFAGELKVFDGSMLGGMNQYRTEFNWLRGRLALAAGRPSEARRQARALAQKRQSHATVWGLLLDAGAQAGSGRRAAAADRLAEAASAAEAARMPLYAQIALRRRGELLGDAQAVAGADTWLRREGVRRPDRLTAVIAPGFAGAWAAAV